MVSADESSEIASSYIGPDDNEELGVTDTTDNVGRSERVFHDRYRRQNEESLHVLKGFSSGPNVSERPDESDFEI